MRSRRQRHADLFLVLIAFAAAVISCAKPPLPIGFVGPLTGPSSSVGLGARNGFLLALGSDEGAAPGKIGKTELMVYDDGNDQDRCLEACRQLKALGCDIVVLATTSNAAIKAIPWAISEGMLVITPTVSDPTFSGKDDLLLRVNASSASFGERLAHAARERTGLGKVGIIGDVRNENYRAAVVRAFTSTFSNLGGEVVFDLLLNSAVGVDQATLVQAVRDSGIEGLVVVAASSETVMVAKYLEKAGLDIQLLLPAWPLTLDLIQNGGSAVEGVVAVGASDMDYSTPAGKAFRSAYAAKYGEEPSFTGMFGWEATSVLRRALAESKSRNSGEIKDTILRIGTFPGLEGTISFDSLGDASRGEYLFTIKEGRFVRLE